MQAGVSTFGTTAAGEIVHRIVLKRPGITVSLLTRGAVLQGLWLDGVAHSLTLGSDLLSDYEGDMVHFGSLVAPVVNRLSNGTAPIGGVAHQFDKNQAGKHTLHSGSASCQRKIWKIEEIADDFARLSVDLPEGEGGFPGNRRVTATFALHAPSSLRLTVVGTTDTLTLMNTANHSYWNLDGSPGWTGHKLRIAAYAVLPTTADFAPTGEIRPVDGSEFDLRAGKVITPGNPPMDNSFCLSTRQEPLRDVLWLTGTSGLMMTVATTEAGIQVYDDRSSVRPGKSSYEGLAIEAQNWPDAPNHAGFPAIELAAGQSLTQITEWRFSGV